MYDIGLTVCENWNNIVLQPQVFFVDALRKQQMFDHLLETVDPMDFFRDEEEVVQMEKESTEQLLTSIQANGTMPVRTSRILLYCS